MSQSISMPSETNYCDIIQYTPPLEDSMKNILLAISLFLAISLPSHCSEYITIEANSMQLSGVIRMVMKFCGLNITGYDTLKQVASLRVKNMHYDQLLEFISWLYDFKIVNSGKNYTVHGDQKSTVEVKDKGLETLSEFSEKFSIHTRQCDFTFVLKEAVIFAGPNLILNYSWKTAPDISLDDLTLKEVIEYFAKTFSLSTTICSNTVLMKQTGTSEQEWISPGYSADPTLLGIIGNDRKRIAFIACGGKLECVYENDSVYKKYKVLKITKNQADIYLLDRRRVLQLQMK